MKALISGKKMQQNILLHYNPIQHDLFGGLASILGCPGLLEAANLGRLTFLNSLRSRKSNFQVGSLSKAWTTQILATQPKMSCCLCIKCNKRPLTGAEEAQESRVGKIYKTKNVASNLP